MSKNHSKEYIWYYLVNRGYLTQNELEIVTDLLGYSKKVLLDVLYFRTGYKTLEQLISEEEENAI